MMTAELRLGALMEIEIGEKFPPLLGTPPRGPRACLRLPVTRHQTLSLRDQTLA